MGEQVVQRVPSPTALRLRAVVNMRSFGLLMVVAALAYGWVVYAFVSPYAGGSDSSGYLSFARSLTHGNLLSPVRALPGSPVTEFGRSVYQPIGFVIRDESSGSMSPAYPIGYPMHVALATFVIGADHAVASTNMVLALVSLALMYASCRYLNLSPVWSAGATVALAVCPYMINSALQPMSDLPAMTWALATLYAAMRSRDRTSWAILCGACASIALLVRPSNLLLSLPVLVAFGLGPARYALGLLGALPGGLFVIYVNWRLYGTLPFWQTTGYDSPTRILDVFTGDATQPFSIAYFRHHASHFVLWLLAYVGPLVLCGLALPFFAQGRTREWAIHAVWFTALFLPYTVYQPAGDAWWYLRFLLPAFPSLILLATGGLSMLWDRFVLSIKPGVSKSVAGITIALLSIGWMGIAMLRLPIFNQRSGEKIYPDAALWARNHLPGNTMIVCSEFSGAIYYYTDFPIVRFDAFANGQAKAFIEAASAQNVPLYAILRPYEVNDALRRLGNNWTKVVEIGEQKIAVLSQHALDEADKLKLIGAIVRPNTALDFHKGGNAISYLDGGWSNAENPGTWTDGPLATLVAVSEWSTEDMVLEVAARPFLVQDRHPSLQVEVVANGVVVDHWPYQYGQDLVVHSARIPASLVGASPILRIEFRINDPAVPKVLGVHPTDDRNLGLFVSSMVFRRP